LAAGAAPTLVAATSSAAIAKTAPPAVTAVVSLFEGRARAALHRCRRPAAAFGNGSAASGSDLECLAFERRDNRSSLDWLRWRSVLGMVKMSGRLGIFSRRRR
jgi:hypothetical protein